MGWEHRALAIWTLMLVSGLHLKTNAQELTGILLVFADLGMAQMANYTSRS